ncbi:MAG: cobalamin-dependent protein [Magnetococcales bacterium]|nr:cobalamin-dependent protein [Magnetococcales bacterium]MBF0151478.1 cobalamin-dependent protein [Magnetococcales bacterium]MBF0173105.1 cobalamin-dependent protein [Magnetococcales bacterium]MBF0346244.1 cobalamin-dependent protein [Magnetococcales bacterium]
MSLTTGISRTDLGSILPKFREALETYDVPLAESLFQHALRLGPPMEIIEALIVPSLQRIGCAWEEGSIALSQIYLSGRLCERLVENLHIANTGHVNEPPRQAIAVLNDYHLLGKRIVHSMLRASGIALHDYGRVTVEELVDRVSIDKVDILLISTLMLPSALKIRDVRRALDERGTEIRILVGGAPFLFDDSLWHEVGADAMGRNAADAIQITRQWMGERP